MLKKDWKKRGIKVVDISLVRLSFSDNYKQSIERKKIAEQDAETAKTEAEAAAEAEAQAASTAGAKAKAEAKPRTI